MVRDPLGRCLPPLPADIANYTPAQGLPVRIATQIVEASDGRIYAATTAGTVEVDDDRVWIVEGSLDPPFQRAGRSMLQDRCGDWWVGTPRGSTVFVGKISASATASASASRTASPIVGIAESWCRTARGGSWRSPPPDPSTSPEPDPGRRRASSRSPRPTRRSWVSARVLRHLRGESLVRPLARAGAPARARDRAASQLSGGRSSTRAVFAKIAPGTFGSERGSAAPGASPTPSRRTQRSHASQQRTASQATRVFSIAEDHAGNLWFGTSRGLARLDPKNRVCDLLQTSDGLAGDIVYDCHVDASGILWVATSGGVSRIDPVSIAAHPEPPDVILTSIEADGEMVPIPDTGARRVDIPNFPPSTSRVSIAYTAIAPRGARQLEYHPASAIPLGARRRATARSSSPRSPRATTVSRCAPRANPNDRSPPR